MDTEIHPHKPFIPPHIQCLILGSFPGRATSLSTEAGNQWFYAAKRNQFWKIMAGVYGVTLDNHCAKEKLLTDQGIGIADILLEIRRKKDTNQDLDLEIIRYNDQAIARILKNIQSCPYYSAAVLSRPSSKSSFRCIHIHTFYLPRHPGMPGFL